MKSDVRRTQATHHFFVFPLLPLGTSSIPRNRHSHALWRSLFFLAAVRMPVHILDFFNTSQARSVILIASSAKVWSPFAFFTSDFQFGIIKFTSSNLNENHCRILTIFSCSRFSKLRCAKPTREQLFFCRFRILTSSKLRFSYKDSHQMTKVASPRSARSTKKSSSCGRRSAKSFFFFLFSCFCVFVCCFF